MKRATLLALALGGCGSPPPAVVATENAGQRIEAVAVARGIIDDVARIDPVGVYATETDRVCIAPAIDGYRIGATVDYGEGQGCTARGTASGRATLDVRFAEGCRFEARIDGTRLVFPAVLPAACGTVCTGRASLAALDAERLSNSPVEAEAVRGIDGRSLCAT